MAIDPDADDLFRRAPRRPPPPSGPIHPRSGLRDTLRRVLAPIGGLALLIAKFAAKAKFLLLLGFKAKYLTTAGSMVVSVGAYTLLWGWRFAALFVALLFVHELGHAIALRREGIPTSPILFVPFLGAVIGMRGLPRNAWIEAKVGLAGPLLGSAGAAGVLVLAHATNSRLLEAVAFTGFFLNLFNLLPVVPLDGGRAAAALHPLVWLAGIVGPRRARDLAPEPDPLPVPVHRRHGGLEAPAGLARGRDGVLRRDAHQRIASPSRTSASRRARRGHGQSHVHV